MSSVKKHNYYLQKVIDSLSYKQSGEKKKENVYTEFLVRFESSEEFNEAFDL